MKMKMMMIGMMNAAIMSHDTSAVTRLLLLQNICRAGVKILQSESYRSPAGNCSLLEAPARLIERSR